MVKKVADGKAFDLMPRQMHILYHVGWELGLSCHGHHNHIEVTKCLAKSLRKYPSDLLPNEVRILEHVGWWLAGNCHGHHNHETIIRCLASGLGRYSSPVDFLPDPLKKVADGKVFDLLPDPLKKVGHGKVLDLLPNELKTVADGRVFDLLGDKVRKIADGKVMDLLPDQLKILFHLGWELTHTCRSHLNHITVSKCLASSLAKFSPPLDFLPDPLKKVAHGSILDLMPQPVQLLAGGEGSSVKTVLTMGNELAKCENPNSQEELVQCLGFRIISSVPPLNFLNRLGDIFAEFVGTFAKVASAVATQAMKGGQSLLQEAFSTDFPKAGAPAVLHHQTPNFVIRKHSQKAPRNAALLQELGDDKESPPGISWSLDDHGPEIRELVTQFDGRETSTGSCLAFAPRNKTGSNNQATQQDWQAASKDDFVKLEPWAVPCTNTWMKDNWKKWQGYSFYTSDMQIERCVTVSFGLDMQPVVAFVGGIQFSLLPKPLAEVNTQVCWPKTQPGGLDLSVLRSEIKSSGILLFSRTLRLTKRFGEDTDFTSANINGGHQTAQTYFSVSEAADAESGTGISSMKRSASLLEGNRSIRGRGGGAKKEKSLYWKSEDADFYVASVDYGLDLGVNTTSESQGTAAEELLRASEEREETFKLFSFKNSGTVNFEVKGLLSGNWLQLGLQMGFGPYQSPEQVIPLVNIVDQFALILMAMPDELVSLQSRTRAIAALKDFSRGDVLETQRKAKENKAEDDKEGWSFDVNSPPVSSGRQRPVQAQEPSVICQGSPVEGSSCSHLEEPDCESYFVKDGDSYMQCAWVDGRCLTMGAACYTTTTTTTSTTTTTTTTTTSTSTTTTTTTSTSTTTTTTTSTSTTSTSTTTTTTTSTSTSTTSTSTTTTTSTTTATTTTSTTTTTTTSTVTTSTVTITSTTTTTITTTTLVPIPPDSEMAPGVECDYFYGQAQCQVPDLASLTPEHSAVLPNIDMHNGRFPHVRAADNFCLRCKGYVSIKEAGNYKFHTGSSDGSLLYVNGQMLVDNNGCHGEQWRTSVATFFSAGAQELVFEMCDAGGAESFRLHYEGPDTNHHAPVIPASALKHHRKGLGEGLRCDYFYNWHHCHVPNLGDMTPAHSQVLPNVDMHHGRFPHLRQTDHFCIRCSGYVSTTQSGNYRFYTASDDGSFLFLNGERIVDNNGCHGEQERSSHDKFLGPGLHSLVVDMCELGGHENFKVRYSGPDTGNHKVTIPSTVLKHEPMQISDGLECDYFYSQHHCHVPNLGAMTPAHSEVLPNVDMHHGRFPHLRQTDHFCIRCSGYVSTTQSGNYRFYTASDDGSFLFLNGERIVDNNGCHGEQERSSHDKFLEPGLHSLLVDMCEMGGHENFKVRYSGPDTGNHKVTIPASVLKHEVLQVAAQAVSDGLECDYFYSQHHCHVPNLGAMTPAHSEVLANVDMHHGRFPHLRQTDHFCIRCSGYVSTTQSGNYRFYTASDDGSFLFLNGERIVDNNGCHGEQERSSHDKFLEPGLHRLVVDMCEMGGHENFKVRYSGPDTGNHKVTIPASVLKH